MSIYRVFFPEESRSFWGKRWLNVVFRSLHLCGIAVYTGGLFFDVAHDLLLQSYLVSALSGLAIIAMDLYSNGKWIFQNRGFFIILKIVCLGFIPHLGPCQKWGMIGIIVLSSVVSHATANFRYYSFYHRKRI